MAIPDSDMKLLSKAMKARAARKRAIKDERDETNKPGKDRNYAFAMNRNFKAEEVDKRPYNYYDAVDRSIARDPDYSDRWVKR